MKKEDIEALKTWLKEHGYYVGNSAVAKSLREMENITLEQTCECCPEQYWAKIGSHIIGYIRLRFGHLTCDYLKKEGTLTNHDVRVYEYLFNDEYKGCFHTDEERQYHLDKCINALLEKFKEGGIKS